MISGEIESLCGKKSGRHCGSVYAKGSDFIAAMRILSHAWAGGQLYGTSRPVESHHYRIHAVGKLWDRHRREYRNRSNPSTSRQDRQGIIQVILRASGFDPSRVYQK